MPLEKISGEGGIARERVVAGVRRKVGEKVWIIREPFVGNAPGNDRRFGVGIVVGNILVTSLSLINLKISMRTTALLGIVEFLIFLVLSIVLLTHSHTGFQPSFFTPAASADGYGGLLFAFVFDHLVSRFV